MRTTIKTRLIRALVGMLSGATITAVLAALLFFLFFFLRNENLYSERITWAVLAGIFGGAFGYVAGLILGLFLGFIQRGSFFGAVCGAVYGVVLNGAGMLLGEPPRDTPETIFCGALIPVTMLSGLSVSLVLSAITSVTRRKHNHELLSLEQVLLRLEQNNAMANVLDADDDK